MSRDIASSTPRIERTPTKSRSRSRNSRNDATLLRDAQHPVCVPPRAVRPFDPVIGQATNIAPCPRRGNPAVQLHLLEPHRGEPRRFLDGVRRSARPSTPRDVRAECGKPSVTVARRGIFTPTPAPSRNPPHLSRCPVTVTSRSLPLKPKRKEQFPAGARPRVSLGGSSLRSRSGRELANRITFSRNPQRATRDDFGQLISVHLADRRISLSL